MTAKKLDNEIKKNEVKLKIKTKFHTKLSNKSSFTVKEYQRRL